MPVTIREVAKQAGVSVATVSRCFNNSGPVRTETRRRIEAVARQLRFSPNLAARGLATRRTYTLGVLLPDLYGEFFSEIIRGIDQAAQQQSYHLLLSSSHSDPGAMEAALRSMRGRVDGLLVMSPGEDGAALDAHLPEGQPVVLLNGGVETGNRTAVTVDNYGGAYEMVSHLIAVGHRRIAIISGPERNSDAAERLRGYRTALHEAGIEMRAEWVVRGDFTERAGHAAAREIQALSPCPQAIFAANDSMAIGALSALRDAGVRVPADMAVAGFDDIPIARYTSPPLTSVHVPIAELGARAVARLLSTAGGNGLAPPREVLPTTLVVRASCGAPLADSS